MVKQLRADDLIEQLKEENQKLNAELDQADIDIDDLKLKLSATEEAFSKLKTETSRVINENYDLRVKIKDLREVRV